MEYSFFSLVIMQTLIEEFGDSYLVELNELAVE